MDKKPLIAVSILAVVIVVLSSLSNVVGYQSVKSNTVNDSPLFKLRTQRATNQKQKIYICQYLGMGKHSLLQFPVKDNLIESLKEVTQYLSKMDEQTYSWFMQVCIKKVHQNAAFDNVKDGNIKQMIQLIMSPKILHLYAQNYNVEKEPTLDYASVCYWWPGCLLALFLGLIYSFIVNGIPALVDQFIELIIWVIQQLLKNPTLRPCWNP